VSGSECHQCQAASVISVRQRVSGSLLWSYMWLNRHTWSFETNNFY